ncbi:GIY-YIG nuclease family protein [Anaerostipes hadrus]|nr:GIY-YIG nuclease family protein [Anaerostipes hadrus]NSH37462.1 GIY-YIG nuclease family protein [Anaerostipes hadrus]NSH49045.1 GIY-YIG nuclease family protein [Anaerostipes hadrus]
MRQEAAERKALEAERKKIEQEESKYNSEIQKLNKQLSDASEQESDLLKSRILELESQLANVIVKKEEIATLAQGKAGNVYIISNVGSFGENIFKIGMTRRLEPQDRVDELGSASVPFKFDVHSFIFSDDAVALENKLHEILNNKRVNKVNMRKEFFKTSIDELEQIVNDIDPTAEFKRTILAEEYRQSLSEEEISNSSLLSNTIKDAI